MKIIDTYIQDNKEFTRYENGRLRVRTINEEPTKTDQTQKEQCDIKNIMKMYGANSDQAYKNIPEAMKGIQGDFTNIPTFQQMCDTLNQAQASFDALPSKLRKRFDNDPKELISFLEDPTNNEEAYKLGLKIKPTTQIINPVETNANKKRDTKPQKPTQPSQDTDSDD